MQKYWSGQRVGRTDRLFGRTKCELSFLRSGELYVCVVNVNATEVQLIDEGEKARCLVKGGRKDKKNRWTTVTHWRLEFQLLLLLYVLHIEKREGLIWWTGNHEKSSKKIMFFGHIFRRDEKAGKKCKEVIQNIVTGEANCWEEYTPSIFNELNEIFV